MRNIILSVIILLIGFSTSFSQQYNTAIGLRFGTDWGATFQQRILNNSTIEIIAQQGLNQEVALVSGFYEHHFRLGQRRLNMYAGVGAHKGWFNDEKLMQIYENPWGVSLITGFEMTLAGVIISWDIKPAINLNDTEKKVYFSSGVSFRYVIIKRKSKTKEFFEDKKWKFWDKKNS